MADHLNVNPRAEITKIAVMNAKGINLEIFEYSDTDAAVAYLKAQRIKVLGEPTIMTEGPTEGESWVYFMSPWGMQLELVSYPNGKAYAHHSSAALFDPR